VVIGPDRLFISKGYGIGAAAFDITPGADGAWSTEEAWRAKAGLKTKFTNVAFHDGHVYGLSDGILECLRASDGKRMWKGGRYDQGQLLRAGNLLVVQAESGDVVLVEATPEKHRELARLAALSDQTWNSPAIVGDKLLVRNAVEAACYRLPLGSGDAAADKTAPTGAATPPPEIPPTAGQSPPESGVEKPAA
jgi:outer membrane protein assembly factor BamB